MLNDFVVFILSHGRPDRVYTIKTLLKQGYTGDWYIVIDNEDKTAEEYYRIYGKDKVIQFDKLAVAEQTDTVDNFTDRRVILFARNVCFELAKKLGYRYFLELDDDYVELSYRYIDGDKLRQKLTKQPNKMFEYYLDFLKSTDTLTITMAQGGDFIGGAKSPMAKKPLKRKAMNTFFCDVEKPFQFLGRINEDVNTYTLLGNQGKLLFMYPACMINQKVTQSNSGGMTEIYLDCGTYVKSFYSVIVSPQAVKISTMGDKEKRIHHVVNWGLCTPKILNEKYKKK